MDVELAVQRMSALEVNSDYLLTRNLRDYDPATVDVLQPIELLAVIHQES